MKVREFEQELNRFTLVLLHDNTTEFVEIHESSMDGWMLYECFFLPSYEVCYFGWDENADRPELINLKEEMENEKLATLGEELVKYKSRLLNTLHSNLLL